jgi:hypothetical protein
MIATNRRNVIWLGWVRKAEEFSEQDAFLGEADNIVVFANFGEVLDGQLCIVKDRKTPYLIFQPDCKEAIECFTLNFSRYGACNEYEGIQ